MLFINNKLVFCKPSGNNLYLQRRIFTAVSILSARYDREDLIVWEAQAVDVW